MRGFVVILDDGRMELVKAPKGVSYKSIYEQIGWGLESQGVNLDNTIVTINQVPESWL